MRPLRIVALQHGVSVETLRHAITRLDSGEAAGPRGRWVCYSIGFESELGQLGDRLAPFNLGEGNRKPAGHALLQQPAL